jgi:hypothetical protein
MVMIRVAAPNEALLSMLIFAVALPLPVATPVVTAPIVKSPPIVMPVNFPVNVRLAFAASVPPLIINGPPEPIALVPPRMIMPLLSVNPPVYALPFAVKYVPAPLLINPVPAAVDMA